MRLKKNLCFVNASLQLLYSIPDVRDFFNEKEYRLNYEERLPVCDEICRIFRTEGKFRASAAELRRLTGLYQSREDISNGTQQDMEEYTRLLLELIENELGLVGESSSRFMAKFWGKEMDKKMFLNTRDGACKFGHMPRREEELFQVIRLKVPDTSRELSLNNLTHNYFAESTETIMMKCSDCCKHVSNCPQTGNCKLREAVTQKCLLATPTFLFIQLLRFDHHQHMKIESIVIPENVLILPNGDKYKLFSIANHHGSFINNGHYEALIKSGTNWIEADDDRCF